MVEPIRGQLLKLRQCTIHYLHVANEPAVPLVSGRSRAQGKGSNKEGVEQGTEDGGEEQHGAH